MNEPQNAHQTFDQTPVPSDSLGPGLAAAFGQATEAPRSSFGGGLKPVVLPDVAGESSHIVKTQSDALPKAAQAGDRYQLSGEIARGGMGAVLRGRDVDLGRDLAIKVLLEKHAQRPEIARRFLEEAQIGGQLQHPGVVPVYDIGRFGERPFFTMKLVKGKTLAEVLAERKDLASDRARLLGIALQVSQTLAYAHAKGVIHRDLKPANIMVGSFGEVQVMDWGLAKVLASGGVADEEKASRLHQEGKDETHIKTARSAGSTGSFGTDTEAGSLLGTPAYMPPEQANGDVTLMDRRADVFGLGAILCEILTGKPPYVGRSQEEVRRKAANGDLADAYSRLDSSGADKDLNTLTRLCLSPEPMDRPKDAQAVAESLSGYLDGVQARLRQAELAEAAATAKAIEETKRRKVTMALATLVVATVGLGGAGYLWYKADHDARIATLNREVHFALNQAKTLREEAKTQTTGNSAILSQAREVVQRALALVQTGQVDGELVRQVHSLKAELDDGEKDLKLLADLEEARLAKAGHLEESFFSPANAIPLFREAFEAYGLTIGKEPPGIVAERFRQKSPILQLEILTALMDWKEIVENPNFKLEEPHLKWVVSLIDDLIPNEGWLRKIWFAVQEKDPAKRQERLVHLAEILDEKAISAAGLVYLAQKIEGPARVKLLRKAQLQFPGDFWVNHQLGESLWLPSHSNPPQYEEAIRFTTAAVALRPQSSYAFVSLGIVYYIINKPDLAMENYSNAIRLNPNNTIAHIGLGAILCVNKKEYDKAIQCSMKVIEINKNKKTNAMAYYNMAVALAMKGQMNEAIIATRKSVDLDPDHFRAQFNLACYTAIAASAWDNLSQGDRARLRSEARESILKGLGRIKIIFKDSPIEKSGAIKDLKQLKIDPDLASIRDPEALKKLPIDEQKAFAQVWAEVDALLKQVSSGPSREIKP